MANVEKWWDVHDGTWPDLVGHDWTWPDMVGHNWTWPGVVGHVFGAYKN